MCLIHKCVIFCRPDDNSTNTPALKWKNLTITSLIQEVHRKIPLDYETFMWLLKEVSLLYIKATFICRISAVSNAIQTIDNEANHLIIYCLNCIRHGRNATYEPGLRVHVKHDGNVT